MKFYYIDDTMFQNTPFQNDIRQRFISHMRRNQVKMIFISSTHIENKQLHAFIETYKTIPIIVSPATFDYDGLKGNLHTTFLNVDGYPAMNSYTGSCVEYDMKTRECQRIYFEFFKEHEESEAVDVIVEELEKVIQEKMKGFLKKKSFN